MANIFLEQGGSGSQFRPAYSEGKRATVLFHKYAGIYKLIDENDGLLVSGWCQWNKCDTGFDGFRDLLDQRGSDTYLVNYWDPTKEEKCFSEYGDLRAALTMTGAMVDWWSILDKGSDNGDEQSALEMAEALMEKIGKIGKFGRSN
jgi:hypothetical protein